MIAPVETAVLVQLIVSVTGLLGTLVVAVFGYLTMKASHANHETLKEVATNVNGKLKAMETVAQKMSDEVERLQTPGTTTPAGEPSETSPVTITSHGRPQTNPQTPGEKL